MFTKLFCARTSIDVWVQGVGPFKKIVSRDKNEIERILISFLCFSSIQMIGDLAQDPSVTIWFHPSIKVAVAAFGTAHPVFRQRGVQGVSQVLDGGGAIASAFLPIQRTG